MICKNFHIITDCNCNEYVSGCCLQVNLLPIVLTITLVSLIFYFTIIYIVKKKEERKNV